MEGREEISRVRGEKVFAKTKMDVTIERALNLNPLKGVLRNNFVKGGARPLA